MERLYRVGEVAALIGVSIRTLHHYDHVGVLCPSGRTEAGYRLYAERDLLCLQQILTLRYLGLPLQRIGELLRRPDFDLVASLRIQRNVLRERAAELERIESALGALLADRVATGQWNWELATRASAAVHAGLEERETEMSDYYTPDEMRQAMGKLGEGISAEEIQRVESTWTQLIADVRAHRDLDPASPAAQALADRWNAEMASLHQHYASDPKLWSTIGHNYDEGAYSNIAEAPTPEDFAFIERVNEARSGGEQSGS